MYNLSKLLDEIKGLNKDILSVIKTEDKLVLIFRQVKMEDVLRNSTLRNKFLKLGLIPVIVSDLTIIKSLDVYPLEYMDMIKKYEVLYGEDIFSDIKLNLKDIRLETEQKFKGVEIRLNQIIFEVGKNWKNILKVCFLAMEDIFLGLKGLLYLNGKDITETKLKIIEEAENIVGFKLNPIKDVLKLKNKEKTDKTIEEIIYEFHIMVGELARFADQIGV